jgi:flagella basal body P-ring formation protein FlgA
MTKTLQSLALSLALLLILGSLADARSASTSTAPTGGFVTLRVGSEIEDDIVRLGDLFDGITDPGLSATPVARAPEPGVSVEVGARWLYAVAKAHGVAWQPRSRYERISLKRASLDVAAEEVELALRSALADQGLDGNVQLVLDNPRLRPALIRISSESGAAPAETSSTKISVPG